MTRTAPAVLAIDIGGTKIAVAIVASDGEVLWSSRTETAHSTTDPRGTLIALVRNAASESHDKVEAVGLAIPAVLDVETDVVVSAPNLPAWDGLDLHDALTEALPVPIGIEYDGHAAAIGESWIGAGAGIDDFITVAIGTGIGCGIIANGRLVRGATRLAGAAGWMVIGDGPTTWESVASADMMTDLARTSLGRTTDEQRGGMSPQSAALFDAAATGHPQAVAAIDELGRRIGIGVANLVSTLDPTLIILTGGIGSRPELIDPIRRSVSDLAQPTSAAHVHILTSPLGSDSVMFGAAKSALYAMENDQMVLKEGNIQ